MLKLFNNKIYLVLLWIIIFLYPILFIWQGLDFTDTGFFLYSYKEFFHYGDNPLMVSWLTGFIGHLNYLIFGKWGIIGFRIGFISILWLSILLIFIFFRKLFPDAKPYIILLLIFITYNLNGWNAGIFTYTNLTAFFLLLSIFFLIKGLFESNLLYIFFSGFFNGCNIFIRIPNIINLILFIIIIIYYRKNLKSNFINLFLFFIGIFISVSLILFFIYRTGQIDIYYNNIRNLLIESKYQDSIHSFKFLLFKYIRDYLMSLIFGIIFILPFFIKKLKSKLLIPVYFIFIGFSLIFFSKYFFLGIFLLTLLFIILKNYQNDIKIAIIALTAIFFLVLPTLGSNTGIGNSIHGYWLALPFIILYFEHKKSYNFYAFEKNKNYKKLFLIFFLLFVIFKSFTFTYRDLNNRFKLTYKVKHSSLKYTYTNFDRARVVEELLEELNQIVKPYDTIFAYPSIPLLHYITSTYPYLGNPWPEGLTKKLISERLNINTSKYKMPIIIHAKGSTRDKKWPNTQIPEKEGSYSDKWKIFQKFEQEHNYKIIWENNFFEIKAPFSYSKNNK
jgi:hypothetical protein